MTRYTLRRLAVPVTLTVALSLVVLACQERAKEAVTAADIASAPGRSPADSGAAGIAPAPPAAPSVSKEMAQSADASFRAVGLQEGKGTTPTQSALATQTGPLSSSMIIRTGWANVEVDSLESAIDLVRQLAQRLGGYVANTSMQGGNDQLRSATIELKVPSARFDEAITGLSPLGKVEAVNVTAEDVGEEFVDITARVANARRLEERLIELLANRTGRLLDVLSVERELARVREEIERHEGRLRFLRARTAMSTLAVTVHEPAPIIGPQAGDGPIVNALREAWRNFVTFTAGLIASLGVLIPVAVMVAAGWWLWRRVRPARTVAADTATLTPQS